MCVLVCVCVEGDNKVVNSTDGGLGALPSPRSGTVRGLRVLSLLEHDPNVLLIPQEWRNGNGGIVFIKKKQKRQRRNVVLIKIGGGERERESAWVATGERDDGSSNIGFWFQMARLRI